MENGGKGKAQSGKQVMGGESVHSLHCTLIMSDTTGQHLTTQQQPTHLKRRFRCHRRLFLHTVEEISSWSFGEEEAWRRNEADCYMILRQDPSLIAVDHRRNNTFVPDSVEPFSLAISRDLCSSFMYYTYIISILKVLGPRW